MHAPPASSSIYILFHSLFLYELSFSFFYLYLTFVSSSTYVHSPSASSSIYSLLPSHFLAALSFSLFYLYFPSVSSSIYTLFFYFHSRYSRFLLTYILLLYCLIYANTLLLSRPLPISAFRLSSPVYI